jgi:hypothetical protein
VKANGRCHYVARNDGLFWDILSLTLFNNEHYERILMDANKKITLRIPPQDRTEFTLFEPNAAAALSWAQALPVANTASAADQLSQALSELNRCTLGPELRFNILEALMPSLEVALSNLAKRFLNQPPVMPQAPLQMAEMTDKLNTLAGSAYTIVAVEAIQQRASIEQVNPARLTCEAIQRALIFAGSKVLLTYQLYRPLEIHAWNTLHQLFTLADSQQLADLPIPDPRTGGNSIKSTYLRALLLGCSKPNRLRQNELTALWHGLARWSEQVELRNHADDSSLFLVDLDSDQPPLYITLFKNEPGKQCRYIDTRALLGRIVAQKEKTGKNGLKISKDVTVPATLLDHMIESLGSASVRNYKRTASTGELLVCVGLSSAHYHLAGEKTFEKVLFGPDYTPGAAYELTRNPFIDPISKVDVWQTANPKEYLDDDNRLIGLPVDLDQPIEIHLKTPLERLEEEESENPVVEAGYPVFTVALADASPGGYCLEWKEGLPTGIKSGDIVGLKEAESAPWVIAVIRWLSRRGSDKTLVGLELLSPKAVPYGATIHQNTGQKTPPQRVLLLPEIKQVGQPNSLITPKSGFREQQKLTLGDYKTQESVQLLRQLAATGSFAQFEYRHIQELGDLLAHDDVAKVGADYDSLWSKI